MKEIISNIKKSLSDGGVGYSSRKLSAFVIIICDIFAHIEWLKHCYMTEDFSLLTTVLTIDYGFILTLLGLTTYSKIKAKEKSPIPPNITEDHHE